jgi:hypothetical protein
MNIKLNKKLAIKALYNKGESIETLTIITGLSKRTILGIINSNESKVTELMKEWNVLTMHIS